MKVKLEFVPDKIQKEYNIANKIVDGHVYFETLKGMYGLLQPEILANQLISQTPTNQ